MIKTDEPEGTPGNVPYPDTVLFRSRLEITRVLEELARDGAVLTAQVGSGEQLFLTRVLHAPRRPPKFLHLWPPRTPPP